MKKAFIQYYHHIIKDSLSFWLLVIVLATFLFALSNVANLISGYGIEYRYQHRYKNQFLFYIYADEKNGNDSLSLEDYLKYIKAFDDIQSDEKYIWAQLKMADEIQNTVAYIMLTDDYAQNLKTVFQEEVSYPIVYIGHSREKDMCIIDGKHCLKINDRLYQVKGIYNNVYADNIDERVVIPYDILDRDVQAELIEYIYNYTNGMGITIYVASQDTIDGLDELLSEISIDEQTDWVECSSDITDENTIFIVQVAGAIIMIVFALVNCVIISILWMQRIRKEIAIRFCWGAGGVNIGWMLLKNLGYCIVCAIPIKWLLDVIYNRLFKSKNIIDVKDFYGNLVILAGFVILVSGIIVICVLYTRRLVPSEELK